MDDWAEDCILLQTARIVMALSVGGWEQWHTATFSWRVTNDHITLTRRPPIASLASGKSTSSPNHAWSSAVSTGVRRDACSKFRHRSSPIYNFVVIDTADIVCGKVYVTVWCPSVYRLSILAIDCCCSDWQVCCCGPGGQELSVDCCTGLRRPAATAPQQHGGQQQRAARTNRLLEPSAKLYRRQPGLPGRLTHHLEQPAGQRDIRPVSVNLPSAFENISVPGLVPWHYH